MAKLALPRLIDVEPTLDGLKAVTDRLTSVSTHGAPVNAARIVIRAEDGRPSAAIVLTISDGRWADCSLSVGKTADIAVFGRVNRLLNGYTVQHPTLPSRLSAPPKVGKYWRSGEASMFVKGRVLTLPCVAKGTPSVTSTSVGMIWKITEMPISIGEVHPDYAPLSGAKAKVAHKPIKLTSRGESVGVPTPTETPEGVSEAPKTTATKPPTPKVKAAIVPLPEGHPGIFRSLPLATTVHVNAETKRMLGAAFEGFLTGDRTVIILRGPSGSGKTITLMDLAAQRNLPFWKVDVAALRDFSDWAGSMTLQNQEGKVITGYTPSQFVEAVSSDGPYAGIPRLVLLDEINRAETAGALNALLPILDGTGTLYVPDAHKSIVIDPTVLFCGTANIGAGFTGTAVLDEAFVNRGTCWIDVAYPDSSTEATILVEQGGITAEQAAKLVAVATQVRSIAARMEIPKGVSTRQLVAAARLMKHGLAAHEAARAAFGNTYDPEGGANSDRSKVNTAINASLR